MGVNSGWGKMRSGVLLEAAMIMGLEKGSGDGLKAEQRTHNAEALKLEVYVALLKSANVVKIVSYVNYEDCVARNANGEECRIVLPGYSRERGGRVFNNLCPAAVFGNNVGPSPTTCSTLF
jgi:hypothetical protein